MSESLWNQFTAVKKGWVLARKTSKSLKQSLVHYSSGSLEAHKARRNTDNGSLAYEFSENKESVGNWARDYWWYILTQNLEALYPCPENLRGPKLKSNKFLFWNKFQEMSIECGRATISCLIRSNVRESGAMEEHEAGKETGVVSMCKVALKTSPTHWRP